MAKKLMRVPWLRWHRFKVEGLVREAGTGRALSGLMVRAFDKDLVADDHLGDSTTDENGHFEIHFTDEAFKDLTEAHPDLYLCIFAADGRALHDTEYAIREDASHHEYYDIEIPAERLNGD